MIANLLFAISKNFFNVYILIIKKMNLKDHIRSIKDYPKKGILFRDITTLIKDEKAFGATIDKIIDQSKKYKIDKIAAIESRGFVFASAVSYLMKKPFILLRKKNKLPADTHSIDFKLEYGTATIEVHKDSINENDSVLIIDDLIATGGTAEAAAKLIEISKGKVAAFIFVINLFDLGGCENLIKKGYKVENLMDFPGH
jgi:adenine phosphoribosyltransferase